MDFSSSNGNTNNDDEKTNKARHKIQMAAALAYAEAVI